MRQKRKASNEQEIHRVSFGRPIIERLLQTKYQYWLATRHTKCATNLNVVLGCQRADGDGISGNKRYPMR